MAWSVCVCTTDRYPEQTAGSTYMPFGMWGGVSPSNQVLDGGPDIIWWLTRMERSWVPHPLDFFRGDAAFYQITLISCLCVVVDRFRNTYVDFLQDSVYGTSRSTRLTTS